MFYFPPEIASLLGLALLGWLVWAAVGSLPKLFEGKKKYELVTPFLELNVEPVSEGDSVSYAFVLDGRYTAHIENKRKKAKLDIEADSQEELEQKVADTFRVWAITGKKKAGR